MVIWLYLFFYNTTKESVRMMEQKEKKEREYKIRKKMVEREEEPNMIYTNIIRSTMGGISTRK